MSKVNLGLQLGIGACTGAGGLGFLPMLNQFMKLLSGLKQDSPHHDDQDRKHRKHVDGLVQDAMNEWHNGNYGNARDKLNEAMRYFNHLRHSHA